MAVEPVDLDRLSGARDEGSIPLIRPAVTAFIGRTALGPVNVPVRIRSLAEFQRVFGGHCTFSSVSHAVQHYFQHGGHEAVVVRLVNRARRGQIEIPAGDRMLTLQAQEPGGDVSLRASVDYERVETQRDKFNLVVQQLAGRGSELVRDQELFRAVSTNPADPRFIGTLLAESKLVQLSGPVPGLRPRATQAEHPGDPLPYVSMSRAGSDGDALSEYDVVGSNEEGTGLFALARVPRVDLICIPAAPDTEPGHTSFVAAERYSRQRNAMLIWDPPESWRSAAEAVAGMRAAARTGRNALTYFPRIRHRGEAFRNPAGLPACGAIAGGIALADSCGVWDRDTASGVALRTSLTPVARIEPRDAALLKRFGVNVLDTADGRGTRILPCVTSAGAGAASVWRDFHARRLLLFVLGSAEQAAVFAARRAGTRRARARLAGQLEEFLHALFRRGAFAGKAPAQAFFVESAGTSADPAVRFGIALRRPGELVSFELALTEAGPCLRPLPALESGQLAC